MLRGKGSPREIRWHCDFVQHICIRQNFFNQQPYDWAFSFDKRKLVLPSSRCRFLWYSKVVNLFCRFVETFWMYGKVLWRNMNFYLNVLQSFHCPTHLSDWHDLSCEKMLLPNCHMWNGILCKVVNKEEVDLNSIVKPMMRQLMDTFLNFNGLPVFLKDVKSLYILNNSAFNKSKSSTFRLA